MISSASRPHYPVPIVAVHMSAAATGFRAVTTSAASELPIFRIRKLRADVLKENRLKELGRRPKKIQKLAARRKVQASPPAIPAAQPTFTAPPPPAESTEDSGALFN
jgi:hypothetical protein